MTKKLVQYTVTVMVDDSGEFDQFTMRDGLIAGIQTAQAEGGLTTLEDTTTIIEGFNVQHVSTQ